MRPSSKIFMGLSGVLLVALGVLCICNPISTVSSLAWLLGIFVLAAGISTFVLWIDAHHFVPYSGTVLLISILEMLLGILLLGQNFAVSNALVYVFAFFALVSGLDLAIHSFDFKQVGFKGWWGLLIIGILATALGIVSFIRPVTGTNAISILIGVAFILNGVSYFVALFGINKFERKVTKTVKEIDKTVNEYLNN